MCTCILMNMTDGEGGMMQGEITLGKGNIHKQTRIFFNFFFRIYDDWNSYCASTTFQLFSENIRLSFELYVKETFFRNYHCDFLGRF